jgi:hypothetical protein
LLCSALIGVDVIGAPITGDHGRSRAASVPHVAGAELGDKLRESFAMKSTPSLPLILLSVLLIGLGGCQAHQLMRKHAEACLVTSPVQSNSRCKQHSIEQFVETKGGVDRPYAISFVEFDDQGMAWEPAQIDVLLRYLEARNTAGKGTVVMVFVHGWKHNAEFCDPNVACFREMVRTAALSDPLSREVVGVYVGWHGRSMNALGNVTFFARKHAAERVAQGQVRELFSKLLALQAQATDNGKDNHRMRVMFMGHSFGGLITYHALAPYLLDDVLRNQTAGATRRRFADLVLLVNPAFEATHYFPLHLAAQSKSAQTQGSVPCPVFVSITSDNDDATKRAFPIGLSIGTSLQNFKDKEERQRTHHTIGHWDPFKTHSLKAVPTAGKAQPEKQADAGLCSCQAWRLDRAIQSESGPSRSQLAADGQSRSYRGSVLTPVREGPSTTHWVVQTEPPVVDGHNDFLTEHIKDFILVLYNDIVVGEGNGSCQR